MTGETDGEHVALSAADVDLASMTAAESEQWKKLRWVWCGKCGGGSINKVGWDHKKVHGEFVMSLKDAGKLEEAQREFLFIRRGGKVAQAVVARDKQFVGESQCSARLLASSAAAEAAEHISWISANTKAVPLQLCATVRTMRKAATFHGCLQPKARARPHGT